MARFWFIRHGQGFHNLSIADEKLHDPGLTSIGIQQCKTLASQFAKSKIIPTIVICSPLRRTIQTAIETFGTCKPILYSQLKEVGIMPCNNGTIPSLIKKEFPTVDIEGLEKSSAKGRKDWWIEEDKIRSNQSNDIDQTIVLSRLIDVLKLYNTKNSVIAVVGHADLFRMCTGNLFHNCEAFRYTIDNGKLIRGHTPDRISTIPPQPSIFTSTIPPQPLSIFTSIDTFGIHSHSTHSTPSTQAAISIEQKQQSISEEVPTNSNR